MDVNTLKNATGAALDAMGEAAVPPLLRVSKATGHGFDEADDSYRRRLLASVSGAAAAGALSQPADVQVEVEPAVAAEPKPAPELRQDGPTVEEWVLGGFKAEKYPPRGFASRSTDDEINAAIEAQKAAASHIAGVEGQQNDPKPQGDSTVAAGTDAAGKPHLP